MIIDISGKFDVEFIGGKQVVYSSMKFRNRIMLTLLKSALIRMRESGVIIAISVDRHYETLNSYSGI